MSNKSSSYSSMEVAGAGKKGPSEAVEVYSKLYSSITSSSFSHSSSFSIQDLGASTVLAMGKEDNERPSAEEEEEEEDKEGLIGSGPDISSVGARVASKGPVDTASLAKACGVAVRESDGCSLRGITAFETIWIAA